MIYRHQNQFWDNVALIKAFKDPFYLSQLSKYLDKSSKIIEYGCGYGRIINLLHNNGFKYLKGFDFSKKMIDRGQGQFPHLDLQWINHANIPLGNNTIDAAVIATVLCCVPDNSSQIQIIQEIRRVLKPNGILYLNDFLITDTNNMINKYKKGFEAYNEWGIYRTTEGAIVRHFTQAHITTLLKDFISLWYHEEDFYTMNNNPVKTFHGIYRKNN